jgi:hypothetical protein
MKALTYVLAGLGVLGLGLAGYQLATGKRLLNLNPGSPAPALPSNSSTTPALPEMKVAPAEASPFMEV